MSSLDAEHQAGEHGRGRSDEDMIGMVCRTQMHRPASSPQRHSRPRVTQRMSWCPRRVTLIVWQLPCMCTANGAWAVVPPTRKPSHDRCGCRESRAPSIRSPYPRRKIAGGRPTRHVQRMARQLCAGTVGRCGRPRGRRRFLRRSSGERRARHKSRRDAVLAGEETGDIATKSSSVPVRSAGRRVIVIAPVDEIRRTSRGIAIAAFHVPGRLPETGFTPGFC
jgi:hypothetical protein